MGGDLAKAPNHNVAYARALLTELRNGGVREVCLSPGSRSAPLAIALADETDLACTVHIDERVAGFYALGLARASGRPVALVCTSGSAAAHYLPAVIEAHYARVPLVVLSADRPQELREWGAGQTIDQTSLFGSHLRWYAEAPIPTAHLLRHARALGSRAAALAMGPPAGPVHLNLPFREPLDAREVPEDGDVIARDPLGREGREGRAFAAVRRVRRSADPDVVADLVARMRTRERGVLSCGPMDAGAGFASAVASLAEAAGWPVIADGASGLRTGPWPEGAQRIASADLFLRDAGIAARCAPDFVLHLGDAPTSKSFRLWLEAHPPGEFVRIDPDQIWHDPSHLASEVLDADPEELCHALAAALGDAPKASPWLEALRDLDARVLRAIDTMIEEDARLLEPRAIRELASLLPPDAILYVASSMPIRDLDAFLPASSKVLRVLCNRGANGIDGLVASALGAARSQRGPVVLLLGDVALAHDVAGFIASRRLEETLRIVLFDNAGGGIFSFLPIAQHGERVRFREHFLTPPELDVPALAAAAGAHQVDVVSWPHFREVWQEAMDRPGVSLLRIPIDREANLAHFRALTSAAARAGTTR